MNDADTTVDYREVFEATPGLYLLLDTRFKILDASDAYLAATMTVRDEIVGRSVFDVFPDNPDDPQADGELQLRSSLERVVADRRPDVMAVQKYDIRRPKSEGGGFETRYWSPVNAPVFDGDGAMSCIVHRAEDVTEFVRLKQEGASQERKADDLQQRADRMESEVLARSIELRDANIRLRELDQAKTAFFNNVSHEFRTPLTLLLGPLAEALAEDTRPLEGAQRARVVLARRNGLRLLKLVDMLLDFARIEAHRHHVEYSAVDLASLTAELASSFESLMQREGLEFVVDCPPMSEPILVDAAMWERIVLNLVSNAFKFTFAGRIRVALQEAGEVVRLVVSDTGIGIAPDEVGRVFERFHRVARARSRSFEGTGIGLALVRELAHLHHGEVSVESQLGVGTTFTVQIPARRTLGPDAEPALARASGEASAYAAEAQAWNVEQAMPDEATSNPAAALVVVIDDNADMRSYMSRLLAAEYRVQTFADARTALDAMHSKPPDLIISDLMMPQIDGLEFVRLVRTDARLKDSSVMLLSARASDDTVAEGLNAGADDYMVKPFSAVELRARVRLHVARARGARPGGGAAPQPEES